MRSPVQTARWRRVRAQVLRGATVCQIPGCLYPNEPLRHNAPKTDPLKATVDHIIPVAETEGMSPSEKDEALFSPRFLRPAHSACNSSRSAGRTLRGVKQADIKSRDWGL